MIHPPFLIQTYGANFDVQRDYLDLLEDLKPLLKSHGEIIFSNNKRKFKLDHQALVGKVGLTQKI